MKTFVVCLALMLLAAPAFGQWQYGGKYIGIGHPQVSPKLAPDGSGGVYVVWEGYSELTDSTYIMLNRFDTAGVAQFGEDGIAISFGSNWNQFGSDPQISADGYGGCFVLFTQGPVGNEGPMYLQRINHNGEAYWPENIRLIYRDGLTSPSYDGMQILADTSYGIIASCCFRAPNELSILAQRIDYHGNLMWDSSGVYIRRPIAPPALTYLPKLCRSGSSFYCIWLDLRSNETDSDIYIQRFDLAGNVYFDGLGLPVSTAQFDDARWNERNSLQILPDGNGGAITAWTYWDLNYNGNYLLKAQRISSTGQIYWDLNGIRLAGYFSSLTELGLYKMGGLFWAISQGSTPRRYQQFDINGNTVYGDTGRTFLNNVYSSAMKQNRLYTMAAIDGAFRGSKRDTLWNEQWPNSPYIHTTWDENANILPDGFGGMYVTLSDERDFPTDWVVLQRIYPNGHVGGDTSNVGISENNPILPNNYLSLKVYPNPFNSTATISFNMPSNGDAKINIYDELGRAIDNFTMDNLSQGPQRYTWDYQKRGLTLGSGVYFITVTAGGYNDNISFTLIK